MNSEQFESEIQQYVDSTPKSRKMQEEAAQHLPGGSSRGTAYFAPYPFFADHGEGHYVYDVDGNRYLDFMINATSLVLGHANPKIVKVLQEQAAKGTAFSTPTDVQIRMADILQKRVPSVDSIRFTNSGTEGTMLAIRAARAFTGKHKIIKIEGGYHGSHEYVTVSVHPAASKLDPDGPTSIPDHAGQPPSVAEDVLVMPFNDLEECERIIRENKDELACVIIEPVVSGFGYLPAKDEYLRGIRKLTEELEIVLIFDEVQSFRIASGGAQEYMGIVPDMTCFGKIIGGGLPVGAFGGRKDIMDLFNPSRDGDVVAHAGTFNANPMTMMAGEVVLNELTPEVYDRMNGLGEMLRQKLRAVFDELEMDVQVTGIGSLFGIHFTSDEVTNYRHVVNANHDLTKAMFAGLLNEGILIQAGGGGAIGAMTTEENVDTLVDSIRKVVQRVR